MALGTPDGHNVQAACETALLHSRASLTNGRRTAEPLKKGDVDFTQTGCFFKHEEGRVQCQEMRFIVRLTGGTVYGDSAFHLITLND